MSRAPQNGWVSAGLTMLFFGLFLLVGGNPTDMTEPVKLSGKHARYLGGALMVAGFALTIVGGRKSTRDKDLAMPLPVEPWLRDRMWDQAGAVDEEHAVSGLWLTLLVFPLGFAAMAYSNDRVPMWLKTPALVLCGAAVLYFLVQETLAARRRNKLGRTMLRYARFPFFLGESFDAVIEVPAHVREAGRLEFTLRCLQESRQPGFERPKDGERWQATCTVESPGSKIPLSFPLPADPGLSTTIDLMNRFTWVLTATSEAPGNDYRVKFTLPIYDRNAKSELAEHDGRPC